MQIDEILQAESAWIERQLNSARAALDDALQMLSDVNREILQVEAVGCAIVRAPRAYGLRRSHAFVLAAGSAVE